LTQIKNQKRKNYLSHTFICAHLLYQIDVVVVVVVGGAPAVAVQVVGVINDFIIISTQSLFRFLSLSLSLSKQFLSRNKERVRE